MSNVTADRGLSRDGLARMAEVMRGHVERGWGFGVSVMIGPDELSAVPGRYGWMGGAGAMFFVIRTRTWWPSC